MGRLFSAAALTLLAPLAAAQNQINMSPGVTEIGADIFELHMLIMWICVVIGVAVFAVMFYSIYAHQKVQRASGFTISREHEGRSGLDGRPFPDLDRHGSAGDLDLLEVYDNDEAELDVS